MSEKAEKNRFFLQHRKSSAMVVSIIIHAGFLVLAIFFVAVTAVIKDNTVLEGVEVVRPKVNLRKLQVPVSKKSPQPKFRKTIVVKTPTPKVDIKMPEIIGVKGGTSYGSGDGLGDLLNLGFEIDLFGSSKSTGNEFVGIFYDLKQDKDGELTPLGEIYRDKGADAEEAQKMYQAIVKKFITSGWNENILEDFFAAPRKKFTTVFNFPIMQADEAPRAYNVEEQVKPSLWACHYQGTISAPVTGKYRFWGLADDLLMVRIKKDLVLDGSYPLKIKSMSDWMSSDPNSRRFIINDVDPIGGENSEQILQEMADRVNRGEAFFKIRGDLKEKYPGANYDFFSLANRLVIGDWFTLQKGRPVPMEVLIGEIPGGVFSCRLLIERQGEEYPMVPSDAGMRPVLPVFKTAEIDESLVEKMEIKDDQMTLRGPAFSVLNNR